jgi:hypothetical protein
MREYSDRKLESKVASQNRRVDRNEMQKKVFKHLSENSAMRFRSTPGTIHAAAKAIVMFWSQRLRKGVSRAA